MIGILQWSVHFAHFFWQNIDGMDGKKNCYCSHFGNCDVATALVSKSTVWTDKKNRKKPVSSLSSGLSPACDVQHTCDWNSISLVKYKARCQRFLFYIACKRWDSRPSAEARGTSRICSELLYKTTHKLIQKNCFIFNRNSEDRGHALQRFLHLLPEKKENVALSNANHEARLSAGAPFTASSSSSASTLKLNNTTMSTNSPVCLERQASVWGFHRHFFYSCRSKRLFFPVECAYKTREWRESY